MIFTGFLPNATKKDIYKAMSYVFNPFKWNKIVSGNKVEIAEEKLKKYFNSENVYTFDSGRTALQIALESLDLEKGSEVLVQAYTCMVVVNAIVWAGYKPVFVDITDDYNMDIEDLKNKIKNKARAVIIQHTFGRPAKIDEIIKLAKENNLKTIEDCAHSLGAKKDGKLLGAFADLAMFSFGSDKIISCVRGGAILVNNLELNKNVKEKYDNLQNPSKLKTIQYLFNFILFPIAKKIYRIKIGKIILALAKKYSITGRIIFDTEKKGKENKFYPARLANSLADILEGQIDNIENFNNHRQKIAKYYFDNIKNKDILATYDEKCLYLRFALQVENPNLLMKKARKKGIILGDWYNNVIAPIDIDMIKTFYKENSCPKAEKMAKRTLNLPTNKNIKISHAKKIVNFINNYAN